MLIQTCGNAATQERDLVERSVLADEGDALSVHHRVLSERGCALYPPMAQH